MRRIFLGRLRNVVRRAQRAVFEREARVESTPCAIGCSKCARDARWRRSDRQGLREGRADRLGRLAGRCQGRTNMLYHWRSGIHRLSPDAVLVESGRDVVVVGRRDSARATAAGGARYVSCDYGDRVRLRTILAGAAEVIDLAYSTVPQTSFADPVFDIVSNLPPSVGMLQEAVSAGVERVVLGSSGGTVYGVAEALPIREIIRPIRFRPTGSPNLRSRSTDGCSITCTDWTSSQ